MACTFFRYASGKERPIANRFVRCGFCGVMKPVVGVPVGGYLCLVDLISLDDEVCHLAVGFLRDIDIAVHVSEQTVRHSLVGFQKHDGILVLPVHPGPERPPLHAAPFPLIVSVADEDGDQFSLILIQFLEIDIQIRAGKLRLVILVIENPLPGEFFGQIIGDGLDSAPAGSREGEAYGETFGGC